MFFLSNHADQDQQIKINERIITFQLLDTQDQIDQLPALYLFFEQILTGSDEELSKKREQIRRKVKREFPLLVNTEYFSLVFLDPLLQEKHMIIMLLKRIWNRNENFDSPGYRHGRGETIKQIQRVFDLFKSNKIFRHDLITDVKSEISKIFYTLSEQYGKEKTSTWFLDSYEFLAYNFKFLDAFSLLIRSLPEFLLTEQQLNLLSRPQLESMLMEKTEKLEIINHRLKDEILQKAKVQKSLVQNANRFNRIIENAMDAVVLMDSDGKVTYWNSRAEEIFGWNHDEILGNKLSAYIIPEEVRLERNNEIDHYIGDAGKRMVNKRLEEKGTTKSGQYLALELSMVSNMVDDKVVYTAFIRDISERKQYEQELVNARIKAEKASRIKADFLSTMSHEIRTPMNGLFGTIELLLNESPRSDQMEYLNLMKHSTKNLLSILNDILDFSKIESGKLILDREEFKLREVCEHVILTHLPLAKEKGLGLKPEFSNLSSEESTKVIGDPVRLSQVLNNLISNALKFTYEGEVILRVSATSENMHIYKFEVEDTGVGIPENKLSKIFERFTQLNNQPKNELQSGTGLGLSIATKLIELQGSKLHVESKQGIGSNFYFELMLERAITPLADHKPTQLSKKDLSGLQVLVVEDNRINQIVAEKFLRKWNCEVDFSNNGQEAQDQVTKKKYDLILMDLQMPISDGYDASRQIRSSDDEYLKNVPIVALTADVLQGVKEKVIEAGMNDFMTKPFDPDSLYATITRNLKLMVEND